VARSGRFEEQRRLGQKNATTGMVRRMNSLTLVDTDIFVDAGRGVENAVNYLYQRHRPSSLALSVVTQMELMVGCQSRAELRKLDKFLKQFSVVKMSHLISDRAVELLRVYRLSHGLLIADSLIAATALVLKMPFVTNNQRDFRFIKGLKLLPYP
jgi:predicted nucleic acid-binding protein